jgi:formylglycine-generating enzyme required for sulfatase activity
VGKYPVTQAEYTALIGTNPSKFKGDRNPVEMVNWVEATEFCKKVSDNAHLQKILPPEWEVALPTETQWEYFVADAEVGPAASDTNCLSTVPVGKSKPNKYGLHDLRGNVRQWCSNWYDEKHRDRVLRGSAWCNKYPTEPSRDDDDLRRLFGYITPSQLYANLDVGNRVSFGPKKRADSDGFRVVLVETGSH